jgi:two-component system alkaline phosphatase synthesis response regulator PhoP
MVEGQVILIIDADRHAYSTLGSALESAGYRAIIAVGGQEGIHRFTECRPALVVLDVAAPQGWDTLHQLRSRSDTPILILSSLADKSDELAALEAGGADGYMTKPFSPKVAVARITAILRRAGHVASIPPVGPLRLGENTGEVRLDGQAIQVTEREFVLLEALVSHPGRAFSRRELLSRCWGPGFNGTDRVVDVHLASLRRKLGKHRDLIFTIRGVGYKYNPG